MLLPLPWGPLDHLFRSLVTWGLIAWTLESYSLDSQLNHTFDYLLPYSGISSLLCKMKNHNGTKCSTVAMKLKLNNNANCLVQCLV